MKCDEFQIEIVYLNHTIESRVKYTFLQRNGKLQRTNKANYLFSQQFNELHIKTYHMVTVFTLTMNKINFFFLRNELSAKLLNYIQNIYFYQFKSSNATEHNKCMLVSFIYWFFCSFRYSCVFLFTYRHFKTAFVTTCRRNV